MEIDIEKLTEDELIELNHRIVERLKFLQATREHKEMMEFNIGEKVTCRPPGREKQVGVLMKYNKKTVTVVTEQGQRWNVSPFLLSKVVDKKHSSNRNINVIQMRKKSK